MKDLCLNGYIQSCRRLIGNKNFRIAAHGHGDHYTLAHTTGKLMWITTHGFFRICDPYCCQQLKHPGLCLFFCHGSMAADQLHHLVSYGIDRIQCRKRILKNHGNLTTTDFPELCLTFFQNILTLKKDFSSHNPAVGRAKTEHGFRCYTFSTSGFTYNSEKISLFNGKPGIFYCLCFSKIRKERHFQIFYFQ